MRLPRMKPGDLLVIKLWDIITNQNWLPDDKAQNLSAMGCATVGWFVNKDKDFIRITNLVSDDGDKTITVIPKGFLRSVKIVTYDRS